MEYRKVSLHFKSDNHYSRSFNFPWQVHQLGLKFGIYEDFGTETCEGYPGSEFYLQLDAQTFADWGVDYVKFDACNSDPHEMEYGYQAFGLFLNKTGRPMVYACEWPFYQLLAGLTVFGELICSSGPVHFLNRS